jgi:hypothetical protein
MRRALSILLMVVFCTPSLMPLFAGGSADDASVPACCRLHGQHHCLMTEAERATLQAMGVAPPELRAPAPKCPYQRQPVRSVQQGRFAVPVSHVVYAALVSHPTGLAQTQSKWRVSREGARQKRGPPVGLLS